MLRLQFEKVGNAVWISHLDLMRLFQRAFRRAGLMLKHTQGFNPRPSVSVALPMSVGMKSKCELLDFELEGEALPFDEICDRLNRALIDGVRVLQVYDNGRKLRELAYLTCVLRLAYDGLVPEGAGAAISDLFSQNSLIVEKKGKNGVQDQDIIPMIKEFSLKTGEKELNLYATVCCQNPTLNPMLLAAAVERYLPEFQPDGVDCCRLSLLDGDQKLFI